MLDFSRHIAESTVNFAGRAWVFEEISNWLARPAGSRFFLLTGEPGSGKTSIAARLFQFSTGEVTPPVSCKSLTSGFLTASHFCSARDSAWVDPLRFAHALAEQLLKKFPQEYAAAFDMGETASSVRGEARAETVHAGATVAGVYFENVERLILAGIDPRQAFNRSVRNPLENLYRRHFDKSITILVDSLDEALTYESSGVTIVRLLAGLKNLPAPVRFILTSRKDGRVENELLEADGLSLYAPEHKSKSRQDILEYVEGRLHSDQKLVEQLATLPYSERATVAAKITDKADENFQYVTFLLKAMAQGQRSLQELDGLPAGLDELYADSLRRVVMLGRDEWSQDYAPVIGILSVAQEALTFGQLGALTGLSESMLWGLMGDLEQFIETSPPKGQAEGENTYRLYHQSLVDFLRRQRLGMRELRNPYFLAAEEWHRRIADSYLGKFGGDWQACDGYGLRHLALHLKQAEKSDELRQLLLTFRWLQAKVGATDLAGLIADYDYLAADKDLRLIQAALRLSAHILAQDPGQLRSQLFGRLLSTSSPEILGMLDRARSAARQPWLRPLTASLAAERSIRWLRPARPEPLTGVAFSTNGLWAAHISRPFGSVSSDVVLWDLKNWQSCGPRFQALARGALFALALSDDAHWCLYGDSVGGVYRLGALSDKVWEGHAHHELAIINLLAISANGQRALSACTRGRLVAWDIEIGCHEVIWDKSDNRITALSLDAAGERAVAARADGSVDLLDLWPARPRTLFKLNGRPSALARSLNNSLVAAATMDGRIELHSVDSPEPPIAIFYTQEQPTAMAMSSDGRSLAVGSDGGTVGVWSIARGARSAVYHRAHTYKIERTVFSHDDAHVISADSLHIKAWAPEAAGEEERGSIGARAAGQVTATAEGLHAVAVLENGRLGIWNIRTGALESILPHASGPVFGDPGIGPPKGIVLAAKAPRILSWNERLLCVWDLSVGASVGSLSVADTRAAAVTPDGTGVVYINGWDITLWRPDEGESSVLGTYRDDRPDYVVISPDGRRVLSSGEDGRVIVWRLNGLPNTLRDRMLGSYQPDARDKPSIVTFAGHEEVVITTRDGSLFVLDMRKAQPEPKRFEGRHAGWVDRVLVNRDSRLFVTSSSSDQTVQVWDLDARRSIAVLDDHPGCIEQLSRSAERVLLHTYDGVLKIVSLRAGVLLNVFQGDKQIVSCAADAELEWVVARDEGGQMHFLHVEPGASAIGTKVDTVTGSSG